jgi:hypothetical protein
MLYRVETVTFKFRESPDDEYFVQEDGTVVRTVIASIGPAPKDWTWYAQGPCFSQAPAAGIPVEAVVCARGAA